MSGRYVIHLPVTAADLARVKILARAVARSLAFLGCVEAGGITVSTEDNQGVRHWVFCDRKLDDGRRCILRADHGTPCAARPQRPR
ncbi:hypothetical protein AB0873_18620 [Micromonospora sp. NPDC047707]|uniref:hypothetical protein n=1 Tax=Micromonospora sp. NPDC047707 TaxID=3154498 RepID=UPI0034536356